MKQLIVQGTTYNYPDAGENPGWGEDATAWAEAVTEALNSLSSDNDIPLTTAIIADNVAVFTNITGAKFLTPGTKAFTLYYVVNRSDGATNSNEYGTLQGVYSGTDWLLTRDYEGESGMDFNIDSTGQIQYKSSAIGGTYSGSITFKSISGAL